MICGSIFIRTVPALGALITMVCVSIFPSAWAQAPEPGEQSYQTVCAPCHTIGAGRLVGPDLAGVHDRRSQQWLEVFVRSPNSVINSGDADAAALLEDFNGIVMPDAPFAEQEIRNVLSFIKASNPVESAPAAGAAAVIEESVPAQPASQQDITTGQDLFQGKIRFEKDGAACNSCHDVRNDAVIGGGILAIELTKAFSRMGGAGVKAILGQAPFPVMQAAYSDKQLTESEITALVAFLEYADSAEYNQLPRDYGIGLFISGVIGAAILFLLFGVIWRGRKVGSVNQAIYDRQIKSTDL